MLFKAMQTLGLLYYNMFVSLKDVCEHTRFWKISGRQCEWTKIILL